MRAPRVGGGGVALSSPAAATIVGLASTRGGYWEVANDGGVFGFGAAQFYGSMGAVHLAEPVVGMAATPSGRGYWLFAADGGVFSFATPRDAMSALTLPTTGARRRRHALDAPAAWP